MRSIRGILILISLVNSFELLAQAPVADFTISPTACSSENIEINNLSTGYSIVEWDFCETDLLQTPQFSEVTTITTATSILDLRVAHSQDNWYGFVCDAGANQITRLNFGQSLTNSPSISALADPTGTINTPSGIEIFQFNNKWYGIVGTFNNPSRLLLLKFEESLGNTPEIVPINVSSDNLAQIRSIRMVQEGNELILLVVNWTSNQITRINMGATPSDQVQSIDVISVPGQSLLGLDVLDAGGSKYGFVSSYGTGQLFKLSFGSSWSNAPVVEILSTSGAISNPTAIQAVVENGNYYLISAIQSGRIFKMDFGTDLSTLTPAENDLGNFGDMTTVRGLHVVRDNGGFSAFLSSYQTSKIYKIDFKNTTCAASYGISNSVNPEGISFSDAGTYPIAVRIKSSGLLEAYKSTSVVVSAQQAPDVDIQILNKQCLSQPNEFGATSSQVISGYDWSFGDTQTSTDQNPTYTYSSYGQFSVSVRVTDGNGCHNKAQASITVSSAPDFLLPAIAPACTGTEFNFLNQTGFDPTFEPVWGWNINGTVISSQRDVAQAFNAVGAQDIKLTLTTSECVSEVSKTFFIAGSGSLTDFSVPLEGCQTDQMTFTNQSASDVTSMTWDFGDGNTSDNFNPTHRYTNADLYLVKLKTSNSSGCENEVEKQIQIYTIPQPNFAIEAALCSNAPDQFQNASVPLPDSQVINRLWDFGDGNFSFSENPLHVYVASGDYQVSLFVKTSKGCVNTISQTNTVIKSTDDCSLTALFEIPETVCQDESISIKNFSTNGTSYSWDFCEQDLTASPQFGDVGAIDQAGTLLDFRFQNDNGMWYGFTCDIDANKVTKLFFGNSLHNIPVASKVGDFVAPSGVEIVSLNGNWYGLVATFGAPSQLYLLEFGSSLANIPVTNEVTLPAGSIVSSRSIRLVQDGSSLIAFLANWNQQKITRINFGTQLSTEVVSVDLIETGEASLLGIDVAEDDNGKYLVFTGYSTGTLFKASFGNSWMTQSPVIEVVNTGATALINPAMVDIEFEGGQYYLFTVLNSGQVYRLNFGSDLSGLNPQVDDLGSFGSMTNVRGMDLKRNGDSYTAMFTSYISDVVYLIDFKSADCTASSTSYNGKQPPAFSYSLSGSYPVTLRTQGQGLLSDKLTRPVVVSSSAAPDISLSLLNNQCLSLPNEYSIVSSGTIVDYTWLLGDGTTSTLVSPTHNYALSGIYPVSVEIVSAGGCRNTTTQEMKIFSTPDFNLPTANPICTNQEYAFSNTTLFASTAEPTWEWYVNNSLVDGNRDFRLTLQDANPVNVKLKASNSECANEIIKTIATVELGPAFDFDATGNRCQGSAVTFVSSSGATVTGYAWDFGDGNQGSNQSASNTFQSNGNFDVELTATNDAGCQNSKTKTFTIYSLPQPNFSLELPPFSCAGSLSQFNDLTPAPTDSNLSSWSWSFGDGATGSSTIQSPSYIYTSAGSFDVSLTTTTNFGCEGTIVKTVQIFEPPHADFTVEAACLNKSTNFADASGSDNKTWQWKIGSSSYFLQNPAHVFSGTGNYTAQLTVTGNNDCISIISKSVSVPVPPILDFSVQNNCAEQATLFQDITSQDSDPAVSQIWDFAGQGNGVGAAVEFAFSTPGTYSVNLTVTNQSGCSYSLAKNTSIVASPIANFSTSIDSGPPPLEVQFTNTSLNATSFQWKFNDADNTISNLESPSFVYSSLGDFVVDLTASNAEGCLSTESKMVHVIIPRTEIELTEFKLSPGSVAGSVRPVLTITNNSNYTVNEIDVVLDISGNALVKEKISAAILPGASFSQVLNYELLPNGSKLSFVCVELKVTGDTDLVNNSACISLASDEIIFPPYPNPAKGELHVDWIATTDGPVKISVISQMGQVAFQKDVSNLELGLNQIIMDVSRLNSGIYLLIFAGQDKRKTFSIVVQN